MSRKLRPICLLVGCFTLISVSSPQAGVCAEPPESPPAPATPELAEIPEPEVLEKGPIHEAFAEPVLLDSQDPLVVKKEPPQPINELPPDERPEGKNVQWIKGYWTYNEEVKDFVWVSGFWRNVPPHREWNAGEWQATDGGYAWSPGFWAESGSQELRYLPAPPASLEQGPSSPAPGDNYLWTPGSWRYDNGEYFWQPGFWYEAQQDWVWVPNHYCTTSQGSVYVNGYWDYPLAQRGLLYAPIYWRGGYGGWYGGGLYGGAYWRPYSIINTGLLIANLFVHNHYGSYYYGYGYGPLPPWLYGWGSHGYNRWGYHGGGHQKGFDPNWAHHKWQDRNGRPSNHQADRRNDGHRNHQAGGRGTQQRSMISSVDKLDQQQRKDLKLRHLSDKEVAQYKQRADKGRKVSRVQVGNGKSSEGRIALDPGRRAWNPADGSQQTVQKNSRERATVSGKELAKARSGNKASPTVRDNKGSRSGVNSSPGSSARSRVQGQNSNRERSVLTSRDSTAKRTPAQSGAARQSFPPARQSQVLRNSGGNQANVGKVYRSPTPSSSVRSAQPSAQRQVYRVPSSMQHYGRQSTPRVQSNYRGSSRMQGSSRSFQRSGGSYSGRGSSGRGGGGRGGGGGGGRGGGGRGRGR